MNEYEFSVIVHKPKCSFRRVVVSYGHDFLSAMTAASDFVRRVYPTCCVEFEDLCECFICSCEAHFKDGYGPY